jgi:hypothetical protein
MNLSSRHFMEGRPSCPWRVERGHNLDFADKDLAVTQQNEVDPARNQEQHNKSNPKGWGNEKDNGAEEGTRASKATNVIRRRRPVAITWLNS